ncbi:two-component system, cell cycle response regulator [Gammaproteobacteria bacterium]
MTKPSALHERIAKLRQTFISQLPERLATLEDWLDQLRRNPHDHRPKIELHRLFHTIKGTSSSFQLPEIHATALAGQQLLTPLLDKPEPLESPLLESLQKVLQKLSRVTTALADEIPRKGPTPQDTSFQIDSIGEYVANQERITPKLVYFCDDEQCHVQPLAMQLSCFGYQSELFESPQALYEAVVKKRPDAVILDIIFPEGHVNGIEILTTIQEKLEQRVPAVFLSGHYDFSTRLKAVQAGGAAFFPKPVKVIDLAETLDNLTAEAKPPPFRILVVDDDPEMARYHSLILEDAGMITTTLHDPTRILEVLHDFHADLILMDMYMPLCNGQDLAKVIRQIPDYLSLPIVYLSGETNSGKQFSAMRVGAEDFLTKPIQPEQLVSTVLVRVERMRVLRSLMTRDSLTGLYNHTSIKQFLTGAIASASRHKLPVCFAMLDVDRFKSVNDTYGHPVGDQVLVALSRVLRKRLRNSDLVGRYGGEEFAVVMPEATLAQGVKIINELREDFAKVRFFAGNQEFNVTFSCGVAFYPECPTAENLCEIADKALYKAKHAGRNQVMTISHQEISHDC